jgi:hypothetical protein
MPTPARVMGPASGRQASLGRTLGPAGEFRRAVLALLKRVRKLVKMNSCGRSVAMP